MQQVEMRWQLIMFLISGVKSAAYSARLAERLFTRNSSVH